MIIRAIVEADIKVLEIMHKSFFSNEFGLDNLLDAHLLQGFVAVNDQNEIICAGGIRTLAEIVLIQDKNFPLRDRRDAYYKVLEAGTKVAKMLGYDELHASVQSPTWLKHLKKAGFHETKGRLFVRPV